MGMYMLLFCTCMFLVCGIHRLRSLRIQILGSASFFQLLAFRLFHCEGICLMCCRRILRSFLIFARERLRAKVPASEVFHSTCMFLVGGVLCSSSLTWSLSCRV